MRDFFKVLRIYVAPYKGNLIWSIILTIFSAVFNIFSFALIIPILQILFGMDTTEYVFIPWDSDMAMKEIAMNNMYYYVTVLIDKVGGSLTLLYLGLFMLSITCSIVAPSTPKAMLLNIVSLNRIASWFTFPI